MNRLIDITDHITDGVHGDCENEADSGYYFISVKDLEPYRINYQNARQITYFDFTAANKRTKLEKGDVLFANSGDTIGKMLRVKESNVQIGKTTFQKSIAILKPNINKIEETYFYYLIKYYTPGLRKAAVGSAQKNLLLSSIRDFKVEINHKFSDQRNVVVLLDFIDSKIELNNRINVELEAMAKTLYDYWFVQFDFPNANGKPYKTSGGKMLWNEELKREIPEGWKVEKIGEYADVKKGDLITAKDAKEGSIKVVAAGIDYSYLHSTPNRLKNTITISGSGANAGYINFWREPIFASDCITVRGKSDVETLILLQYLNFIQTHILSQATGSAQPHVYPSDIKVLNYVIPPDLLIENYGKITMPMNEKIGNNLIENQQLSELRDWLLPMLMNGQVKVADVEEELGMAAEPETKYGKR